MEEAVEHLPRENDIVAHREVSDDAVALAVLGQIADAVLHGRERRGDLHRLAAHLDRAAGHVVRAEDRADGLAAAGAEQARKAAGRCDRRLRNTKLLLKNYRMFKKHCTGAVYTDEAGEHDGQEEETALELLDMMLQRNNAITVESIRNSCRRTKIMIRHIDAMLGLYETYCAQSDNEALKRGLRIIKAMYIDETAKPVEQIAMQENVSARQVYRDHDAAVDKISMLMFGIDALEMS